MTQTDLRNALGSVKPSALRGLCPEVPSLSWDDIAGLESVKRELQELVSWPIEHASHMHKYGMRPSSGALLFGPTGCGKTLLARAAASCCGANFIAVSAAELLDKWFGGSEQNVRHSFS